MKKEQQRIKRILKLIVFLEECRGQYNGWHKGIDNYFVCNTYDDMFGRNIEDDFTDNEICLISNNNDSVGAWLTDHDESGAQECRDIKIIALLLWIEILK